MGVGSIPSGLLTTSRRFASTLCALTLVACETIPHAGDTEGVQLAARWEWHGRLRLETDSQFTVTRLRIDSGLAERHDVILARYDFNPVLETAGDEYAITIGLDLGVARELPMGDALTLGPGGRVPAYGTVACLCRPLRPDSVRGSFVMMQRGIRQITARIDATLYLTAWHDSTIHTTYRLRQVLFGVK